MYSVHLRALARSSIEQEVPVVYSVHDSANVWFAHIRFLFYNCSTLDYQQFLYEREPCADLLACSDLKEK